MARRLTSSKPLRSHVKESTSDWTPCCVINTSFRSAGLFKRRIEVVCKVIPVCLWKCMYCVWERERCGGERLVEKTSQRRQKETTTRKANDISHWNRICNSHVGKASGGFWSKSTESSNWRWTAMCQFYEQHWLRRSIAANAHKCLSFTAKATLTLPLRGTNGDPCIYLLFSSSWCRKKSSRDHPCEVQWDFQVRSLQQTKRIRRICPLLSVSSLDLLRGRVHCARSVLHDSVYG